VNGVPVRARDSAWFRIGMSVLVGAALLGVLGLWGDVHPAEIGRTLARLDPRVFAAALAIHFAIYVARAERFRVLLAGLKPRRFDLLAVTSAHNLAVYVLPAKTGEATLPLYLKATSGVPASESLASLIVSRILDLAALFGFMAAVTLALSFGEHWTAPAWAGWLLAAALGAGSIVLVALAERGDLLVGPVTRLARMARLDRTGAGARLVGGAERLQQALRAAGDRRSRTAALAQSVVIWALIFVFYGVLALGFGLDGGTGFLHATFGSSVAVLMNLLPINSFAGFGTQETGWVLGFRMVGVAPEVSLSSGIAVHLVQLFDTVLFGALGHIAMGRARRG
jgi:uncharacterized protein (TIRG00374 family)